MEQALEQAMQSGADGQPQEGKQGQQQLNVQLQSMKGEAGEQEGEQQ